jgi:hypothetical protein
VLVAVPVPAGVLTVVDFVVSVVVGVLGGVSAGFTSTFVVAELDAGGADEVGVTSALQPASAMASRAATRYVDFIVRFPSAVGLEKRGETPLPGFQPL